MANHTPPFRMTDRSTVQFSRVLEKVFTIKFSSTKIASPHLRKGNRIRTIHSSLSEDLIKKRQQEYYDALGKSDMEADSGLFVELMLDIILDTLNDKSAVSADKIPDKVQKLLEILGARELSSSDMMEQLGVTRRATFRKEYLQPAMKLGLVVMECPDRPSSRNQRYLVRESHS
ncbi:MAG: Fic family protein [Succinivibrio sp.]